ncbi:MAG: terpene cyclase/mutase family protein [Planctomycetaceae bacterium]|nr:terpene cyclase/mutase family protein [Planctomycetaceae bacterium]
MAKFKGEFPAADKGVAAPKIQIGVSGKTTGGPSVHTSGVANPTPANSGGKVQPSGPASASGEESIEEERPALLDRFTLLLALPSFLISLIVHVVMTAVAALIVFTGPQVMQVALNATSSDSVATDELDLQDLQLTETELEQAELTEAIESQLDTPTEIELETPNVMDTMPLVVPDAMASLAEAIPASGAIGTDALMHRNSAEAREQMLKNNGGTAASEAAVELGLKWLAAHQLPDGSWDLNHQVGPGRFRQSPNPGRGEGKFGATGLALLPFLGKGYTHMEGKYQTTVRNGLAFLIRNIKPEGINGGSFMDARGNMYSHAICAITLCEAFGMTKDPKLREPAIASLRFIVHAQDPIGGGWRYTPQMAGDTSVVGWQLMALKSGSMMGEQAPPFVFERTKKFLNFVQSHGGTRYGYDRPSEFPGRGTTAVGVLSRMYLGWNKDTESLKDAVKYLSELGPDTRVREGDAPAGGDTEANMYYNYYTTQIMRHYGGEPWEKWNEGMREFLIRSQNKEGFTEGSWFFDNGHSSEVGGRLYTTAMAVMTLEVYYRHLPLYRSETLEDEFPLD